MRPDGVGHVPVRLKGLCQTNARAGEMRAGRVHASSNGARQSVSLLQLQKFASVHANVHNHFNLERHIVDRETFKIRRSVALAEWQTLIA